jgi:acetoacetyl-CoA synthetase
VQGHGGITLELRKALALGCDVRPRDRFFFVTSTSWMVWNFLVGGLLVGASIVCYDGSPTYPDLDGAWSVAERTGASVVRVGAAYLLAGAKADRDPRARYDLTALRSILQTGSTLPVEAWHWTCEHVRPEVWLQSICGGTDVCSALAAASPLLSVHAGRIPGPSLGVALEAWDEAGRPVVGEPGELVVTRPMPSMPLRFVNDADGSRYLDAYFATYPGVWRHGDWVIIGGDLSVTVGGRSDSTLNRMGVRMGSADIYAVLDEMPELADSMVLGIEQDDGGYWMPLFVPPGEGVTVDDQLIARINTEIRTKLRRVTCPTSSSRLPAFPGHRRRTWPRSPQEWEQWTGTITRATRRRSGAPRAPAQPTTRPATARRDRVARPGRPLPDECLGNAVSGPASRLSRCSAKADS